MDMYRQLKSRLMTHLRLAKRCRMQSTRSK